MVAESYVPQVLTNDQNKMSGAARELQILVSLEVIEKSLHVTRDKVLELQNRLGLVLIPENPTPEQNSKEGIRVSPAMSECARKVWELHSYVCDTNRILDDISSRLDL